MSRKLSLVLAVVAAVGLAQIPAFGAPIIPGLVNTGASPEGEQDRFYQLVSDPYAPEPTYAPLYTVESAGFPFRGAEGWLANTAASSWIAPRVNYYNSHLESESDLPATYYFRTTFDLGGMDLGSVALSGRWAMDNLGVDIIVNGRSTGQTASPDDWRNYREWFNFAVPNSYLVAGVNTLVFAVQNGPSWMAPLNLNNPTGLRVEFNPEVLGPVPPPMTHSPEPGTVALLAAGLAGIALLRRRRTA